MRGLCSVWPLQWPVAASIIVAFLSTHRTLHQNMQGRCSVSWTWLELFQVSIFTLSCQPEEYWAKTCRVGVWYHEHGWNYSRYQYLHYLVNSQDIAPKHAGPVFGIMNMAGTIPGTNIYIILSTHRTLHQNMQGQCSVSWTWQELFQVPIFTLSCPPIGHCTKTRRAGVWYHEHGRSYSRYQYLHYLVHP